MRNVYFRWLTASLLLFLYLPLSLPAEELKVYLPTVIPVKDREEFLKRDVALKGLDITVFGKFREFKIANQEKAKYLIVPFCYIKHHPEYKPVYQLGRDGATYERMMILSADPGFSKKEMYNGRIGAVDELGRCNTKAFVKEIAGNFKMIKSVTKPEDLYPLLILRNSDYIIIRSEDYKVLKDKFTTQTILVGTTEPVNFPVICLLKGSDESDLKKLQHISTDTLKALGYNELVKID